jgi:hypothetical protein
MFLVLFLHGPTTTAPFFSRALLPLCEKQHEAHFFFAAFSPTAPAFL